MKPPDTAIADRAASHWEEAINKFLDTYPLIFLIGAALGALVAAAPYLHRMYVVHTATRRVETFFARPCEETYLAARDFCERHCIQRVELPRGYYAKIVRMEQAIHALRALGSPAKDSAPDARCP